MEHIAADNPAAALEMDELFLEKGARLRLFPYMGRPGILPGTHELTVHPNYRLVYEVTEDEVQVLNVMHARRNWPP